jgi:hypothetical protein
MKKLIPEIKPKEGFGELKFGELSQHIIDVLGEPEEVENIQDDDEFNTTILNYWDIGISAFFEGVEKSVLSCFETDMEDSTLFSKKVFELSEKEIVELMKSQGYELAEAEDEPDGERRLSYDDALIDFFFFDKQLVAVNWGVLVNEQGEVEEF